MVLSLGRMCQCGLLVVLWSHIGILMRRLAAEPRSTAGLLFHSQCLSGTILVTPYSMVRDCLFFLEQSKYFFIDVSCSILTIVFYVSFSLLSVYRLVLCGWGIRTDRCRSLSLSLALLTSFNNNNSNIGRTLLESRDAPGILGSLNDQFIYRQYQFYY